jgi:putative ABC transport system permease protein
MVRLAWRMLRMRPASALATLIALCFGVAVVTACGVLLESGLRYHGTPQRYAASTLLVASTDLRIVQGRGEDREADRSPLPARGPVGAALAQRAAALPGVRTAVADTAVRVQVMAAGVGVPAAAHPWSAAVLAPFTLRSGTAPASNGQVALDMSIAAPIGARPGSRISLMLPGGVSAFTVAGIVAPEGRGPPEATVFLTDAEARVVAGHPATADVIGVIADPGVDARTLAHAVSALLPPVRADADGAFARVFTGADRGLAETPDVGRARELAVALPGVFGGCTLFIAVLVIAGTVGLSVQQRHRDIALLRAIAATPRQVRRMVVREAVVLSLLAGASGVWAGFGAVHWLRDQFVARGMTPPSFTVHVSWLPPLVAVASGLLIAVVAAWVASLRASRIRPTEALVEASVERRRLGLVRGFLGIVAVGGGITLSVVSMNVSGDGAVGIAVGVVATFVTAVALLAVWLIRAAAAMTGVALRRAGVTGRLAVANTAASARRLSAVISALVLAVGLGGSMWFLQTSIEHRAAQQNRAGLLADAVVTPPGDGLPHAVAAAVRGMPGVLAATGVIRGTVIGAYDGSTELTAQGVDTAGISRTMDLGVVSGTLADLSGNAVAVDRLTADAAGLHVGDMFQGWFGDGTPTALRVAAIYTRGLGFAALTVPAELLRAHTDGYDSAVLVSTRGADRSRVAAALAREVDGLVPGAAVVSRSGYQAVLDRNIEQNAWTNQVIIGVLLVYVVIAAVNTLVTAALGRRRELATLRLAGTTRLQVLRMVRLEQALLLSLALVVGVVIAAATLVPMVKAVTGSAVPYIPIAGWAAVIGGTVLLGSLATVVPIRRVLRINPVEAIGIRE